ncbi:hypothetical protein PHB09_140 [Pseudomonas phage PHB09]|uniref:Uncharacterized protein n=1 Tax=Pseudomonas phage PHB09 TaxID=2867265 RepID=A0AAE8XCF2_9CAUD|nr:hypothetical protein QGX10_gp139 [Pseudomonas phage PHB09]UAV84635.1 hypothetical protein PHB09_140 [Pseudomonas phage PHB09]
MQSHGPKPTKDKTILIGSTVKVINKLKQFSNYKAMADYMGLSNWEGKGLKEGCKYIVVAKACHEYEAWGEVLGLMDEGGDSFMIGIEGVKLLATAGHKSNTLAGQVAALELQLQEALAEVETLKALVENIKNLVK